jgi:hypothetical protein
MKPAKLPTDLEAEMKKFILGGGDVEYLVLEADVEANFHISPSRLPLHEAAMRAMLHQLEQQAKPKHLPLGPLQMAGSVVTPEQFLAAISDSEDAVYEIGVLIEEPPFRLGLMPEDTRKSFDAINALLFGNFSDDLEIVRWSEGGLEWWGAFWWTVHNRTKGQVVVIAVSAMD